MSPDRRYNEDEINEIFRQAASDQEHAKRRLGHSEGLTLSELKEIGEEAGITPEFIERAAAAVAPPTAMLPTTTYFGIPVTAGRTVALPGQLSDEAWDRLVVQIRETFHATGKTRSDGNLREWRNGNLHILVEPAEGGHQIRMRTLNESQRAMLFGGFAALALNLVFLAVMATSGKFGLTPDVLLVAMMGAVGLGFTGIAAFRLPRWAEERGRQMDSIAARAVQLVTAAESENKSETAPAGRISLDASSSNDAMGQIGQQRRSRA